MKILRITIATVLALLLPGCATTSHTTVQLNTPSQYATPGWVYPAEKNKKDLGIVFIHGKRGNPGSYHNHVFISKMRELGYPVIAPVMPWSEQRGYEGTRTQGLEVISAAVNSIEASKVVIVGHSMGGMAVMQYGAAKASPKVIGLVSVAPGHDPGNAEKLRVATEFDADRACTMVAEGKGKEHSVFTDMNAGTTYDIDASAEYYCSYFYVNHYPDSLVIPKSIQTPVFILSGSEDRLTLIYEHKTMYDALPRNGKNTYKVMSGGHLDVLYKHTEAISQWIKSL
jgi:pimeloyl-ACP methyl ester carboxylesterase